VEPKRVNKRIKALRKVSVKSLEFHNKRRDLEKWAEKSLKDKKLAKQLREIRLSRLKGEKLRKAIVRVVRKRFSELSKQVQLATQYF